MALETRNVQASAYKDWRHPRAAQSHAETRKLLTSIAVGSIGVLYVTLVGRGASDLQSIGGSFAITIVVSMALAVLCGISASKADAAFEYQSAQYFSSSALEDAEKKAMEDKMEIWLKVRTWCDRIQLVSFVIGLGSAAWLTAETILS